MKKQIDLNQTYLSKGSNVDPSSSSSDEFDFVDSDPIPYNDVTSLRVLKKGMDNKSVLLT